MYLICFNNCLKPSAVRLAVFFVSHDTERRSSAADGDGELV